MEIKKLYRYIPLLIWRIDYVWKLLLALLSNWNYSSLLFENFHRERIKGNWTHNEETGLLNKIKNFKFCNRLRREGIRYSLETVICLKKTISYIDFVFSLVFFPQSIVSPGSCWWSKGKQISFQYQDSNNEKRKKRLAKKKININVQFTKALERKCKQFILTEIDASYLSEQYKRKTLRKRCIMKGALNETVTFISNTFIHTHEKFLFDQLYDYN